MSALQQLPTLKRRQAEGREAAVEQVPVDSDVGVQQILIGGSQVGSEIASKSGFDDSQREFVQTVWAANPSGRCDRG